MQWRIGLITAVLSIGACEGSGGGGGPTAPADLPEPAAVAKVEVTPREGATLVGGTVQFVATAFDRDGNVLARATTWEAMNTSVADISEAGLARGKVVGSSAIRASVGNVSGSARLDVLQELTRKPDGPNRKPDRPRPE